MPKWKSIKDEMPPIGEEVFFICAVEGNYHHGWSWHEPEIGAWSGKDFFGNSGQPLIENILVKEKMCFTHWCEIEYPDFSEEDIT